MSAGPLFGTGTGGAVVDASRDEQPTQQTKLMSTGVNHAHAVMRLGIDHLRIFTDKRHAERCLDKKRAYYEAARGERLDPGIQGAGVSSER